METIDIEPIPAIVAAIDQWLEADAPEHDDDLGPLDLLEGDRKPLGAGYDGAGVLEHEP
jgi:hypothetical protein